MQGKRPVDLCSGGVLWSCCVPYNVQASPAGVISDPGRFCSSNYVSHLIDIQLTMNGETSQHR